ncbi:hypothetical protein [Nonomuraea sp. NPDC050643]|uniref:hypothetical protein n=1 Tax=Nonomuraea sp. NPDC050643 TaxID=3155660 RepID=UPI0033FD5A23
MPVVVGAAAAILTIVLVGTITAAIGGLGDVELVVVVLLGLIAGVMTGVWEVRRRR